MEHAAGRSMRAVATLTTAGALALAPIAIAPPDVHAPRLSPARASTQAVQLTDAWSDLATNTVVSLVQLGQEFLGSDGSSFPLPNPTIPLAPVATQLVLNQLIYLGQLFTGQANQIPTEIATHLSKIVELAESLADDLPEIIIGQIQTPFLAVTSALDSITSSGNLLIGLLEAPAVFLDVALNSQYGLIGFLGPIAVPIIIRNLLTEAIYTPLPAIVLPFKKPAAAANKTVTVKVASPSGTATSARSKPKAPASSSRKAASAKADNKGGSNGQGHSKRG